jgi:peptidylprolyl isomerase
VVSKRRQRELARQRHIRRQQQLAERRTRQRRRNAVVAAVVAVLLVVGGVTWAAVALGTGGKKKSSATPAASASATPSVPAAPTKCAPISPNPPAKGQPKVPDVTGTVSTHLVKKDVKVGTGAVAKTGSTVSVTYIGVSCSTGKVFDASYKNGNQPFEVSPLGSAGVIAGWNQGLIGARAGGERELIIPPDLGYGEQGSGEIKPNEVLIFLIDIKSVK